MSLFGALDTSVSGLNAQAAAFTNISDDVANSQTVGFKRVDTNFIDYLTYSTATQNISGSVATTPQYVNDVQGTLSQSSDPLALAIGGQGFFAVSKATSVDNQTTGTSGSTTGSTVFSPTQYYSQTGDFTMNEQGYLVNSASEYLQGWSVDPTTLAVNTGSVGPIKISEEPTPPVATTSLTLSANLPAVPATGTGTTASPITTTVEVYDATGTQHTMTLDWVQTSDNNWTVDVSIPDDAGNTGGASTYGVAAATVNFGATASSITGVADGTIGQVTPTASTDTANNGLTPTNTVYSQSLQTAGTSTNAGLTFKTTLGGQLQTISLSFGDYNTSSGVTQFGGSSTYDQTGVSQNGVAAGAFSGVSISNSGDVSINYTNGQSSVVYQVPIATFNSPDQLTRQNGQSFTANDQSGTALLSAAGTNAAGQLIVGSTEASNVDIATEFTNLIVAQQAYSANAKVVTAANQLMTTTLDMKQ